MNCTLMHKRIPVAELELDDATGYIQRTGEPYAPEHLPLGVPVRGGAVDRAALNTWWIDRAIPASRSGLRAALEILGVSSTPMLLLRCCGLSLSDQYWIRPDGSELEWENVNFFGNDFSDDIGDILFGESRKRGALSFNTPDCTSDGNLKKRWKIIDGRHCLIKGGSNPFRQQPLCEVIASGIAERLGIPHVPYTVVWDKGAPYSVCEDFITADTELIPAWRIMQIKKKSNSISVYGHFIDCCKNLGIGDPTDFLDRMIVLDYIIANEDRHLNNFGAIRNAETLEWLDMAPIYDSGSSLGYDKMPAQMRSEREIGCKPFKTRHIEQLRLVSDFDWIDFDALSDIRDLINNTLSSGNAADYIDENRKKAIADGTIRRIGNLRRLAEEGAAAHTDTTDGDVAEDIADSYDQ